MPRWAPYIAALIANRAVRLHGMGDCVEPSKGWREFMRTLRCTPWGYVFRNYHYARTAEIAKEPSLQWIDMKSREAMVECIASSDLWLSASNAERMVWKETFFDDRFRSRFLLRQTQRRNFKCSFECEGKITWQARLVHRLKRWFGPAAKSFRFHVKLDGRSFVCCYFEGTGSDGNRLPKIRLPDVGQGVVKAIARLPFATRLDQYLKACRRAAKEDSDLLNVLWAPSGKPVFSGMRF